MLRGTLLCLVRWPDAAYGTCGILPRKGETPCVARRTERPGRVAQAPGHDDVGRVERPEGDVGTVGSSAAARERPRIRMRHGDTMGWGEVVARGLARTVARPAHSWDRCADQGAGYRGRLHRQQIRAEATWRLLAARAPGVHRRGVGHDGRWRRVRNSGYGRSPWVRRASGRGGRTHGVGA